MPFLRLGQARGDERSDCVRSLRWRPTMADIKTLRETMANIATEARSKLSEVTDDTPEERAAEIEREFDGGYVKGCCWKRY